MIGAGIVPSSKSHVPSRKNKPGSISSPGPLTWNSRPATWNLVSPSPQSPQWSLRAIANFNLSGQGSEPERLFGGRISANLLPVLRVSPLLGRGFTEDEDEIGHESVAILSDGLWRRRFGGDSAIVGQSISLSGVPHTVVGVMGPEFAFPSRDYQIWTPLTFDPNELINRQNYSYLAVARLKPGVTLPQ